MKKLFFMLGLCLLAAGAGSCTDDTEKDNARIAELEEQIAALKAQLENNAKITNVAFADGQMTLTFGDGTVLTTDTPIPQPCPSLFMRNCSYWSAGM